FLDLTSRVRHPNRTFQERALYSQGPNLAKLYLHATTAANLAKDLEVALVSAGNPVVLVEYDVHELESVPHLAHRFETSQVAEIAFTRLIHRGREVGVWFIKRRVRARYARLAILRLHAEHEVLGLVLRAIAKETIHFQPRTQQGNQLQDYLSKAIRFLSNNTWQGVELAELAGIVAAYYQLTSEPERVLLLEGLKDARRQILAKVKERVTQEQKIDS